jgi:hypothetical protein
MFMSAMLLELLGFEAAPAVGVPLLAEHPAPRKPNAAITATPAAVRRTAPPGRAAASTRLDLNIASAPAMDQSALYQSTNLITLVFVIWHAGA